MKYSKLVLDGPHAAAALRANIGGSDDRCGACSIQTFVTGDAALHATHADAKGFLDWYSTWYRCNFWFQDAGVQSWEYEETYDNWQDTYGTDAVCIFYHSGHGGMDNNSGIFFAPLGATWGGENYARSNKMAVGNEQLRYLFWSTCQSLRYVAPNSPIRTWNGANLGLRMIFGFQTNSLDSPDYGRFFGQNWNAGQSLSNAWLNASWGISHHQGPSVVAMGANQAEANNRLMNERNFDWGAAAKNWYQWRWYDAVPPVVMAPAMTLPTKPLLAQLRADLFEDTRLVAFGDLLGFSARERGNIALAKDGSSVIKGKDRQLSVSAEGTLEAVLGTANYQNLKHIGNQKAVGIATDLIKSAELDRGIDLKLDVVRQAQTQGGTDRGSGTLTDVATTETTVQFRQVIKGIANVNCRHGLLSITVDNDGKVTQVHNSTRRVTDMSDKPMQLLRSPNGKQAAFAAPIPTTAQLEASFSAELRAQAGVATDQAKLLVERTGYDLSGSVGSVVVHREYEVPCGENLAKNYRVRVPYFA